MFDPLCSLGIKKQKDSDVVGVVFVYLISVAADQVRALNCWFVPHSLVYV